MKAKLNEHQKFLLKVVEKYKITSGELFDLYQKSIPQLLGEWAYRNQMERLVQKRASERCWRREME